MSDQDDVWYPHKVKTIVEWFERHADKSVVFTNAELINGEGELATEDMLFDRVGFSKKYRDYFDAVTPLILTGDDELTTTMLEEITKKTSSDISIYPGLFAGFIESDPEDLLRQIHIIRKLKMNGIVLFDWAHLSEEYLETLKTSVFKVQTY